MINHKIVIDGKSFFFGLVFTCFFIIFSGFNETTNNSSHDIQTGRYHVVSLEGKDIILDSDTGAFIYSTNGLKPNMYRFNFEDVPISSVKTRTR